MKYSILSHLILTAILWGRYYHYSGFTNEGTEAERHDRAMGRCAGWEGSGSSQTPGCSAKPPVNKHALSTTCEMQKVHKVRATNSSGRGKGQRALVQKSHMNRALKGQQELTPGWGFPCRHKGPKCETVECVHGTTDGSLWLGSGMRGEPCDCLWRGRPGKGAEPARLPS